MKKNVINLLLLYSSLTLNIQCFQQSIYEEFNNKQISLSDTSWNCGDQSIKPTTTFSCTKGVDLVALEQEDQICHQIQNNINTKLPHFEIQLYVDVQGNNSIDDDECIYIQVTDQQYAREICLQPKYNSTFGESLYCLQNDNWKYQLRQTEIIQTTHSSENIQITIRANCDEDFYNESYSFRNIQLFVNRCYKTCKTCSGERKDQCTSCYDNMVMSDSKCKSCQDQQNKQYLQIPDGCRETCKQNYSFDEDFVCQEDIIVQKSCQEGCQLCTNTQYCLLCQEQKFLHSGQCLTKCPDYTKVEGANCLNSIDTLKKFNLKIIEEVKEFYDLSTINSNIKQLFKLISTNVVGNFLKGDNIYFSYLSNKRVFGGPFIWKNTKFQFQYNWTKQIKYVIIVFEVILGDTDQNSNKLNYQINSESQQTITFVQGTQLLDPNIKDQNWPHTFINKLYNVSASFYYEQQTNLQTTIVFECQGVNQLSFCAIQNFNMIGFSECNPGYKFDQFNYERKINPCIPICGDKIIVEDEECDDGNQYPFDGCFICRYDCEQSCNNCVKGKCLKYIQKQEQIVNKVKVNNNYEQSYDLDIAQFSCTFQCSFCINNQYMKCNYEYYLNAYANLFMTTCGDFIQQSYEQCDDGVNCVCFYSRKGQANNFHVNFLLKITSYFIESQCQQQEQIVNKVKMNNNYEQSYDLDIAQFSCIFQCSFCVNNQCMQCNYGYYLNAYTNLCLTTCGDFIQQSYEQCDDGNINDYDGCSNCQLIEYEKCDKDPELIKHRCQVCHQGKCLRCNDGFLLDGDVCNSVCGDGLINVQEEECDTEYEGCNKCKIMDGYICGKLPYSTCSTCDKDCKKCTSLDGINLICLSCIDGYYAVKDKCFQCDQNCINCNLQSYLCTSCFREDCDYCESTPGLFADLKIKKCNSICGDGIQVELYEQCDDNNLNNGDGCDSQCNLEYSEDEFNKFKDYESKGNNTYDLIIKQSSNLNLLCNTSNINIDNIDIQYYTYNCTQINQLTCRLSFEFSKSVNKFNIIHVKLNYIRTNQINRQLLNQDQIIEYNIPPNQNNYLDQNQESQKQYIQSFQESFSFFFLIMIPISILLNLFDCLWAVLEILSWINNFYFLNVNYPFNVETFFLNSDWSSYVNLPTYQGLNQPDSNYYFEAPKRFKDKGIDPLFFNNIQTPFMFIAFSFLIFSINYICYQFFQFLNDVFKKKIIIKVKHFSIFNIQICQKVTKQPNTESHKVQIKSNFYLQIISQTLKQTSTRFINQFKQTIQLSLLDITLAIQLQLSFSNGFSNLIVGLNQFFAIITIGVIIFQLYQQYQVLNIHKLKAQNEHFEELYGVYYENIDPEKQFGYYYLQFGQISKILYIYFMVNYYDTPLLQVSSCYLSSSLRFLLLFYDNPYNSKKEYILSLISDFCLSSIILIILLFAMSDIVTINFIEQNKIILGWLIISLVILAIFFEFCILVAGIFMYLFSIFKMIQNLIKKVFNNNKDSTQQNQLKQQQIETTKKGKANLEVLVYEGNAE